MSDTEDNVIVKKTQSKVAKGKAAAKPVSKQAAVKKPAAKAPAKGGKKVPAPSAGKKRGRKDEEDEDDQELEEESEADVSDSDESEDDDAESDDEEEEDADEADEEEDDDEQMSDEPDEEKKPAAKKSAAASKPAAAKAADKKSPAAKKSKAADGSAGKPLVKKGKVLKPHEKIELAMKAYKWWEAPTLGKDIKWKFMEHCGVLFPPAYESHGVKMRYEGAEIDLTPAQEELATYYAAVAKDGPQLGNPKTAKVFNKNFWKDFTKVLGAGHKIDKFESCDFDPIRAHLKAKTEAKKAASKEEKDRSKDEKTVLQMRYGFAVVDGHIEKMGNYNVEPPGLFRGRGEHPKMGQLKKRVDPEDITINVAHMATVPKCPIPGHAWKRVIHDPTVTWLAYWRDSVGGGHKYVFLAASSSFKGRSDLAKYEKARKLKRFIEKIRGHYEKLLKSEEEFDRQIGTAMWIIDRLALRVGGEKDEDEADTVGCCSLRVEHIQFPADRPQHVTLDFLGKDSMRYCNTIDLTRYGETGATVYNNLRKLCKKKKSEEDIFDLLTPDRLNEQLNELMPGLTAKVFRTYNASITLEKELESLSPSASVHEKMLEYNRANREVAILCNHQKTVNAKAEANIQKLRDKRDLQKRQLDELRDIRQKVKDAKGKEPKGIKVKTEDDVLAKKAEKLAKENKAKLKAIVDSEGSDAGAAVAASGADAGAGAAASTAAATAATAAAAAAVAAAQVAIEKWDDEVELKNALKQLKDEEAHLWARVPSDVPSIDSKIKQWEDKVEKTEAEVRNKDENKAVALGTSKINYMDPRITVAWCKKVECPIERVFPKTLIDKFPWAMGAPSTYAF